MSVTGFLIKTIKVAACLGVMFIFIGAALASLGEEAVGGRILGWISLAVAAAAGLAMVRTILPHRVTTPPTLEDLEAQGMVETAEYTATRAIMVEEFDDEGLFYLLDIGEGRTLCLMGQALYDFEPLEAERDGEDRSRRFPNTRFSVLRHREQADILDLLCHGEPFEPLQIFPHFTPKDYKQGLVAVDEQIIHDFTFDELIASKGRLPRSLSAA